MDIKIIKFGETEIEKCKFHQHKTSISIYDLDINKILVSSSKGFKYFIGYKDGKNLDHYAKGSKNERI